MNSVKKNFLYSSFYQILIIILPFITSPYISRILGSSGLGAYSYTYSISSFIAMFGLLGINNHGNRTIATAGNKIEKRSEVFWNIWSLQVIFTILSAIFYLIYLIFFCEEQYKTLYYIEILVILATLFDINWFFFGIEEFKLTVTRNCIIKVISVALIFLFIKDGSDVGLYTLILVGGTFLSNLVLWPFLKNKIIYVKPTWKKMKPHSKPILIMFIPILAVSIYKKMDKIMLGYMTNMAEVGLFENAEKIITIPMGIITAMGNVMLPRMSYLFANKSKDKINYYIEKSMEFVCFISCAMAFGIAAIANSFAPTFFGREFYETGTLIMLLSPTVIFLSWSNVTRSQYLIPLNRDKEFIISIVLGAIINVVLNILLIPLIGARGAAIATFFAEFIVMFIQLLYVWKELPILKYIRDGILYFVAGMIMFVVIKIVEINSYINGIELLLIEIVIGVMVYCTISGLYLWRRYNVIIKETIRGKRNGRKK